MVACGWFYCTRCPKLFVFHFRCTKPDKLSWLIICISISVINVLIGSVLSCPSTHICVAGSWRYWVQERKGRERETCEERGSSLFPRVSPLCAPFAGYNHASSFSVHSTSSMFPLLFVIKSFLFFQILKYKVPFLPQFSKNTLLNPCKVISIWRRICSK